MSALIHDDFTGYADTAALAAYWNSRLMFGDTSIQSGVTIDEAVRYTDRHTVSLAGLNVQFNPFLALGRSVSGAWLRVLWRQEPTSFQVALGQYLVDSQADIQDVGVLLSWTSGNSNANFAAEILTSPSATDARDGYSGAAMVDGLWKDQITFLEPAGVGAYRIRTWIDGGLVSDFTLTGAGAAAPMAGSDLTISIGDGTHQSQVNLALIEVYDAATDPDPYQLFHVPIDMQGGWWAVNESGW